MPRIQPPGRAIGRALAVAVLATAALAPVLARGAADPSPGAAPPGDAAEPGPAGPAPSPDGPDATAAPLARLDELKAGVGRPAAPVEAAAPRPEPRPAAASGPKAEPAATADAADPAGRTLVVRRGDTLMGLLARAGVAEGEAAAAMATLKGRFDPRRLKVGQAVEVALHGGADDPGELRLAGLAMRLEPGGALRLSRDRDGGFTAERVPPSRAGERGPGVATAPAAAANPGEAAGRRLAAAPIRGSFHQTATRAGLPGEAALELAKAFAWDVDFQRDLHPGDRFEALLEQPRDAAGKARGAPRPIFAALHLRDGPVAIFRVERPDGSAEWVDAAGRPLRKWLLLTPVDGARLSSTFGPRRHPILGYTRLHRGVDFAAPAGTPVFAAGDGAVEFAGTNRGYGRTVRIRHDGETTTAYAHLSRFAPGLDAGDRVRQGQVIGYVGSTGLSTGPHLHYEVIKNGQPVNPMSVKAQGGARLAGRELQRLARLAAEVEERRRAAAVAGGSRGGSVVPVALAAVEPAPPKSAARVPGAGR